MPKVTDRHGRPVSGQMPGLVEAIVTDNEDPNSLGRVKVKFPTLPDMPESYWARLVTPMAGEDRGWVTIPEVDDEVLVAFVHGDFNHAIVLGGLYNGVDTPPYANDDGDNNLRMFKSRSGHTVTFDDTDGSEKIEIVTANEAVKITLDAANSKLEVVSDGDISLEAANAFDIKCTDFSAKASGSVTVEAGSTLDFKGSSSATIDGGGSLTLSASSISIG